ncbi:MAG: metal-dependent transcriptional regulator [Armatimonadota bacterium]|nr:metal-dependent transcriptional regulator [Armatimonadota bacterium]
MPSPNVEEYIEALYRLGAAEKPVGTGHLAESLHVVAPSVTTMLKRLVRDGLVIHEPYKGISLTEAGKAMSMSLVRRHRLSERLLTDMIGLPWDKVHEVACKLEHVITDDLEENVYNALGKPKTCPHGHPVDAPDPTSLQTLFDLTAGDSARIVMVGEDSSEFLRYVSQIGLVPGVAVKVIERAPVGDVITIECSGATATIGKDVSKKIWVESVERQE